MRIRKSVSTLRLLFILTGLTLMAASAWAAGETLDTLKDNFSVTAEYANAAHHLRFTLSKSAQDSSPALLDYQEQPDNLIERLGSFYSSMQQDGYDIKLGFGRGQQGAFGPASSLDGFGKEYGLDAAPDAAMPYDPGHEDSAAPSFFLKFQFKF